MVGIGTVLADNPELTVREIKSDHNPTRIVIDPDLIIPLDFKILKDSAKTLIITSTEKRDKIKEIESLGHKVFAISTIKNKINMNEFSEILIKEGLINIGIEGGSFLFNSLFEKNMVNELRTYFGMKFLGKGLNFVNLDNAPKFMNDATELVNIETKKFKNGDVVINSVLKESWEEIIK